MPHGDVSVLASLFCRYGRRGRYHRSSLAKTDSPGLDVLQMTSETLLIDRGAVPPFVFVDEVFVARGAGGLFLEAHQVDGFCLLQVMAIGAALRQLACPGEKGKTFQITGRRPCTG